MNKTSYIISDIMLSVSSFLKNEYGINAIIFPEITYINENDKENIYSIILFEFIFLLIYNTYILIIMFDVIQEKKKWYKAFIIFKWN